MLKCFCPKQGRLRWKLHQLKLSCQSMLNSMLGSWDSNGTDSAFERRPLGYSIENITQALNRPVEENRTIGHRNDNCRDWHLNTQFSGICVLPMENRNCTLTCFMKNIFFLWANKQLYFATVSVKKSLPALQKSDYSLQNVFKKADMCKLKYEVW